MRLSRLRYNYRYGVNWRKPRLIGRILAAYADLLLRRRQPLRYIDVNVGLGCNLGCQHCFAENFKRKDRAELSDEEWRDVIEQCAELGAMAVGFTGGEPLVYPRLFDLIRLSRPERMLILVISNGVLLTPELARRLKDAGTDVMVFSVDSADAAEHDLFRGQRGAWERTMRAFDIAREAGLQVAAVPTVSHHNLHTPGFRRIVEWGREQGILVILSYAAPIGGWAGDTSCLLTEDDSRSLDELIAREPHVRRDFESNYLTQGCGAAIEKLYFTPHGDVLPCPFMHISFGNVREQTVTAIREQMLANPHLGGFSPECLVAQNRHFIDHYLPRDLLKGQPMPHADQVFSATGGRGACAAGEPRR